AVRYAARDARWHFVARRPPSAAPRHDGFSTIAVIEAGKERRATPSVSRKVETNALRVAIVGGSLGGLTTALLLRALGHDVEVFERATGELTGTGAGIVAHEASL